MISVKTVSVPALLLLLSGVASAQATRTWVSGVGDDVNPCSRTAPCKTFAGAISKTAAGGEIDALDPGGFGTLTITKSITVDGGSFGSILASATNGLNINASVSDTVTLRNLSVNGAGITTGVTGVNILAAGRVHLENVVIQNFSNAGISVATNGNTTVTLDHVLVRDIANTALLVSGASSSAVASVDARNSVFQTSGTGVSAGSNSHVLVTNSSASGNSGAGFSVGGSGILTLTNSTATANGGAGFKADSSSGLPTLTLVGSTATINGGPGVQTTGTGASIVRMTGSVLLSNFGGITGSGTTYFATYGDNEITNGVSGVIVNSGTKQ